MKKFLIVAIAVIVVIYFAWPGAGHDDGLTWLTDIDAARAAAKDDNRPILAYFTGSDWCGWCKKLDREILSKPEFHAYAQDHLVLLKLDFPRHTAQPPELSQANQTLAQRFHVRGFPTIVMLDKYGNEIGRTGYLAVTPTAYVNNLDKFAASIR